MPSEASGSEWAVWLSSSFVSLRRQSSRRGGVSMSSEEPLAKYAAQVLLGDYAVTYFKVGHGPQPIFTFPGVMAPMKSSFIPLIALMEKDSAFLEKYTFYGWDQPGYFGSSPPIRKMDDVNFLKDVELGKALLERLGHSEKFVILGYSAGSQTALLFTMLHPHLVKKLLLLGAWDRFEEDDVKLNRWYRELQNVAGPFSVMLLAHFAGEEALMLEHWTAWHDMVLTEFSQKDKEAWDAKFQNIRCPTLIIWGKRDMIVPRRHAEQLLQNIKGSRLEVMEKAPHNVHHVFPDEFFKRMLTFLEEEDKDAENGPSETMNGV